MKPIIVLVGRPNVGKSTLFNRLTRTRDALVADLPGLTRDRHYGIGRMGERPFLVVDTGGLEPESKDGMFAEMARQTEAAIAEADSIVFLVDVRAGVTAHDRQIAERLRRIGRPVWLVVNKAEGMNSDIAESEFHELGLGQPNAISAAHGDGIRELLEGVLAAYPDEAEEPDPSEDGTPKIAIVGRPNVGKSLLLTSRAQPGTAFTWTSNSETATTP
jgi:GTP-binding protein